MGQHLGSYMINKFTEEMVYNIKDNNKLFLYQIFHKIQKDLHDGGSQLIEAKYNNKLEYIKFNRNGDKRNEEMIELQQVPTESYVKEDSVRL